MKKTLIALALTAGATFKPWPKTSWIPGQSRQLQDTGGRSAGVVVDTLKGPGPFTVLRH